MGREGPAWPNIRSLRRYCPDQVQRVGTCPLSPYRPPADTSVLGQNPPKRKKLQHSPWTCARLLALYRVMQPLAQDPHSTSPFSDRILESAIGRQVRAFRRQKGLTVAQLASEAGLSPGMLSKIENGATSPSLTSLLGLAKALSVPMTALFRGFEQSRPVMHVKAGKGAEAERAGTRAGHQYSLLGHLPSTSAGVVVEPYLITLSTQADVFPAFQHEGMEFLYMLAGCVDYRHGQETFRLEPGDSLFFDADAPHGPEALIDLPARYLSIICYPQ